MECFTMRFTTIRTAGGTRAARVDGDVVEELPFEDVGALLASGTDLGSVGSGAGGQAFADADLAPVVVRPSKIFCVGLNYRSHIEETGNEIPTHPTLFAKFPSALIGPRDDIWLPPESKYVDWEAELAFVIGSRVRRVTGDDARNAIAGYTICNDISMRNWQRRTQQWLQGKTWEHATPLGPVLVTPDDIDHARDLRVTCEVDGDTMQDARTSDLVFDPVAIVEYLTQITTLEPGDVVSTGTSDGVGAARQPPVFLSAGQTVRVAIEGIGELVNRCVDDPTA
jgi:acylpyruvate hydrolase